MGKSLAVPRLKLLSFNIQLGINTRGYGDYLTRAWRHALPAPQMKASLDRIADLMRRYDFVAVQEGDAGSFRTLFLNQIEYLAQRAGFPYWGEVFTRNLGPMAQHSMGYLSRYRPERSDAYTLPTPIPGRRAMHLGLGDEAGGVDLLLTHLSLGRRTQKRQIEHIAGLLSAERPTIIMGDLNCRAEVLAGYPALRSAGFNVPSGGPATFPSWRPRRSLDHILVNDRVILHSLDAIDHPWSDHLPVSAEVSVVRA